MQLTLLVDNTDEATEFVQRVGKEFTPPNVWEHPKYKWEKANALLVEYLSNAIYDYPFIKSVTIEAI